MKMAVDIDDIYSSSSDEEDLEATQTPNIKHVFNHRFFDKQTISANLENPIREEGETYPSAPSERL